MKKLVLKVLLFFFVVSACQFFVCCDDSKSTKTVISNQNNLNLNTDDSSSIQIDSINKIELKKDDNFNNTITINSNISYENKNITSSADSIIPPTLVDKTYIALDDIKVLMVFLNTYESLELDDCLTIEKNVKEFTTGFFTVVDNISLTDTVSIAKLKELEHFLVVFEEDFERVEENCPDLYNDYMEYLDDLIDLHYQKLELLFGDSELIE
ncbi:MAG: hypothetical protein PHH30_07275 [Bacteroidales bacterium]|nr:hypothetical protein [Bacteroidales bacterium]MDD3859227.1 hypothetical protein [Bacteroidales bacterium]